MNLLIVMRHTQIHLPTDTHKPDSSAIDIHEVTQRKYPTPTDIRKKELTHRHPISPKPSLAASKKQRRLSLRHADRSHNQWLSLS